MAVLNTGLAKTSAGGYTIDYSCRFDSTRSTHLERTMGTPTNAKKWVYSGWHKQGKVNHEEQSLFSGGLDGSGSGEGDIQLNGSEQLYVYQSSGDYEYISTAKYRDSSAWYHIVVAVDTTQGTASNRVLAYVNGELITSWGTETDPSQDLDSTAINTACEHRIGNERSDSREFDGYIAETHFIDGMSFFSDTSGTANSSFNINTFGETGDYGEWKPKEVSGVTYGNNGFYLDFADAADLGDDESGEGNDFSETNLVASDQMLDTPTNNFPTIVPMLNTSLSEGNLKVATSRTGNWDATVGSMGAGSGKWYYEAIYEHGGENFRSIAGWVAEVGRQTVAYNGLGGSGDPNSSLRNNYEYAPWLGSWYNNSSSGGTAPTITGDGTDIIGFAIDIDNDEMWVAINNVWYANDGGTDGDPAGGTNQSMTLTSTYLPSSPLYVPSFRIRSDSTAGLQKITANFGQDSSFAGEKTAQGNADGNGYGDFYYTPPSGFLALCTANLDTPAVTPSEHFNTIIYDDGAGAKTGVGFQPDLVWLKSRGSSYNHKLTDAVRGVTEALMCDTTDSEETNSTGLTSFDSDGFTVGADTDYSDTTGDGMVAWCWKANGSGVSNTEGVYQTSGTITAQVSANTAAGFSFMTWTNQSDSTIGHGLDSAPELIIVKSREDTTHDYWLVGIEPLGWSTKLLLNTTAASGATGSFDTTAPTSDVWSLAFNPPGTGNVAYCWHSVEGYSKVGSYEGNDDNDGPFVYLGFRPAWIMIKDADGTDGWNIIDSARDTYNAEDDRRYLYADSGSDESIRTYDIDFLSNGFKINDDQDDINDSETYVYLAFAKTPFKHANAR
jgi:hypothetical protein